MDQAQDAPRQLARSNNVEELLHPIEGQPVGVERLILDVVLRYQHIRLAHPQIAADLQRLHRMFENGSTASQQEVLMVRRLIKILQDEKFLEGMRVSSGRVMVVDPDEAVTPLLTGPLVAEGFDVDVVPYSSDVETRIKQKRPDLIISEFHLPLMDGLELCRRLKSNPDSLPIPFLVVTSSKGKASARDCLRSGAEEVLFKPVDMEMLVLKLKQILARTGRSAPAAQAEAGVTGNLRDMAFADLIQIIAAGGRSMAITITNGERKGEVCMKSGEVIHAVSGSIAGEQAFYEFMRWKEGVFVARVCSDFPPATIQNSVMSLLMEGARLADESADLTVAKPG